MRFMTPARTALGAALLLVTAQAALAQNPPPPPTQPGQRGAAPPPGGQRGGGRGGRIETMTLTTTAWQDGGAIPLKHAQLGAEVSPPLSWGEPPAGTASFVLIVRDIDAIAANNMDGFLHWLVWNIPGSARGLPEGLPHGPELPDGTRQISVSGPYYRGPALPEGAPAHHYLYELFALDTILDVPSAGVTVAPTRAAVLAAMSGRIRGKAVLVGTFRRQ